MFSSQDIQQDHIYLFGFFLPQGVTVPTYLKNFEEVVNKFLILKYDERMNALVGYYPRDLQRRSQGPIENISRFTEISFKGEGEGGYPDFATLSTRWDLFVLSLFYGRYRHVLKRLKH